MITTPPRRPKMQIIAFAFVFVFAGLTFAASRILIEARILRPNVLTSWMVSPSEWLAKWLKNPTCKVPCWEKIVPGETNRVQAKSLFSNNPKIEIVEEADVIPYGLMLFLDTDGDKYNPNVSMKFDNQNIVQEIEISTFGQNLYLEDIVAVYGSPKQVLIHDSPRNESVLVDMLYPELGMVASLFLHNANVGGEIPRVEIEKYSEVWEIYLNKPDLEYYLYFSEITNGAVDPRLLSEWKGYTTYP